ncbi:MAG: hypothetical protein IPI30_18760 [Saprospiraceae bacterium]|nr:hypothetical protein [Candidatus Vicinibacter affinis]
MKFAIYQRWSLLQGICSPGIVLPDAVPLVSMDVGYQRFTGRLAAIAQTKIEFPFFGKDQGRLCKTVLAEKEGTNDDEKFTVHFYDLILMVPSKYFFIHILPKILGDVSTHF